MGVLLLEQLKLKDNKITNGCITVRTVMSNINEPINTKHKSKSVLSRGAYLLITCVTC
jgi:hypothetical protein